MAMSASLEKHLINCDLCKKTAVRFCNNCYVSLCVECVSKHVDNLESLPHNIAPLKNKEAQLVISDCETHAGRKCEAYCQQCLTPVCTKCIIGPHKGHDAVDIVPFAELKIHEIEKNMEVTKAKLHFYKTLSSDIMRKISKATTEYPKVEQELARLRKIWQQEVNAIFNEFHSLVKSKKDYDLKILTENQVYVQNMIGELLQLLQFNTEILQSKKASKITNYKNKNEILYNETKRHFDFDATVPSLITSTQQGKDLYVDFGELEATLTRTLYMSAASEFPT